MNLKKILNLHWYENKIKYFPWAQALFLKRVISWDFPAFLNIEITNNCNAECFMCPRRKMNRQIGYIEEHLFKKVIIQIKNQKKLPGQLTLNKDGESLLHPKIGKLIKYASDHNIAHRIELYTNAILLSGKKVKEILDSGLDILYISLDVATPKTYQKIKGIDCYQKVVENVKNFIYLKRKKNLAKPIVAMKIIKMQENEKEIDKFKKIWQNLADNVIISAYHTWEGSIKPQQKQKNQIRYACPIPWYNPVVNWDGKISACCVNYNDNELIMGDINKASLQKIWKNIYYQKLRKAHLVHNYSEFPTCQNCGFWKILPNIERWLVKKEEVRKRLYA